MFQPVGTRDHATAVARYHTECPYLTDTELVAWYDLFELIGRGSQRTVYLHRASNVVYKVGNQSANREEVAVLTRLRATGREHAPETTLWEVTYTSYWGCAYGDDPEQVNTCVVAMPYLPEDGSVHHKEIVLEGAGDLNPGNVHAHGGKLWLIDAGGM